jgi:hypothetical protein
MLARRYLALVVAMKPVNLPDRSGDEVSVACITAPAPAP